MISEHETVPRLRFPGFTADVQIHQLGTVTKVIDCKHRTPQYVEDGIPIVSPGSIRWGEIDLVSPTKRVTESDYLSLMDHCDPRIGDLVLSRNQSLGVASHINSTEKFVLGQDTVLIKQKNGNGKLIFYRLQTPATQSIIERLSGGSTFSRINLSDIRELPLALPTEAAEQRKIADFLTAVDKRIAQLSQKKALLEAYKKGVMQKLFTQALRFRDDQGNDSPDWEEKRVGDFAPLQRGFDLVTTAIKQGKVPVVYSNGILRTHNEHKAKGPGVVTGRSGTIGKVTFVEEDYWPHNTSLWVTNFFGNKRKFVYYFYLHLKLENFRAGSTIPTLNRHDVHEHKAFFPSPPEQTKIANFLTALDHKIEAVAAQIAHTQTFKTGLLQQMFV